jgi:hypothetical protein
MTADTILGGVICRTSHVDKRSADKRGDNMSGPQLSGHQVGDITLQH